MSSTASYTIRVQYTLYIAHVMVRGISSYNSHCVLLLVLRCDDPPAPSNSNFDNNGSIVTYMCEEGFVLVSNRQRFCNFTTWIWNGSNPTCGGIVVVMGISNDCQSI